MTHSYKVTGMTCAHCVQKVKNAIQSIPEVTAAEISLPDTAVIHMSKHVPLEVLQKAISATGHYSITESTAKLDHSIT